MPFDKYVIQLFPSPDGSCSQLVNEIDSPLPIQLNMQLNGPRSVPDVQYVALPGKSINTLKMFDLKNKSICLIEEIK